MSVNKRVAVPVLAVLIASGLWWVTTSQFTLTNESGQSIRFLRVAVAGEVYEWADVPPGGAVSGSFRVEHEATFEVSGVFADGTTFHECGGYVVWEEPGSHSDLVVLPDGWVTERRHV